MTDFVFDIETAGLHISDAWRCMAWSPSYRDKPKITFDLHEAIEVLKDAILKGHRLVGHNIVCFDLPKMCWEEMREMGTDTLLEDIRSHAVMADTLIASRHLFPTRKSHAMKAWAEELMADYPCGPKPEVEDFATASLTELEKRCVEDVTAEACLWDYLHHEQGVPDCIAMADFEHQWYGLVVELLATGVPYNFLDSLRVLEHLCDKAKMPQAVLEAHFPGVNFNSTKQVDEALKKKYGAGLPLSTKTDNPTMKKTRREEICITFPLMNAHFEYKDATKALSFITPPPEGKESKLSVGQFTADSPMWEGKAIYPTLNYVGTRTGRMQYESPPINQMPKKVRRVVRAPKGWVLVGMDIVALEMAWTGYMLEQLCGESTIMDQVRNGESAKKLTLEAFRPAMENVRVYGGMSLEDVAKTINYALIYGIGKHNLAATLNLPMDGENKALSTKLVNDCYEKRFPKMGMLNKAIQGTMDDNVLTGFYGAKVLTEPWKALNAFIQNSGADYARRVMYLWWSELKRLWGFGAVRACVYNMDELQLLVNCKDAVDREDLEVELRFIADRMEDLFKQAYGGDYVAGIDWKIGNTWEETH